MRGHHQLPLLLLQLLAVHAAVRWQCGAPASGGVRAEDDGAPPWVSARATFFGVDPAWSINAGTCGFGTLHAGGAAMLRARLCSAGAAGEALPLPL